MADYTNKGIASPNDRKEPGDKKPDYNGIGNFNGQEFAFAIWTRDDGKLSFKFEERRQRQEAGGGLPMGTVASRAGGGIDDEIPF